MPDAGAHRRVRAFGAMRAPSPGCPAGSFRDEDAKFFLRAYCLRGSVSGVPARSVASTLIQSTPLDRLRARHVESHRRRHAAAHQIAKLGKIEKELRCDARPHVIPGRDHVRAGDEPFHQLAHAIDEIRHAGAAHVVTPLSSACRNCGSEPMWTCVDQAGHDVAIVSIVRAPVGGAWHRCFIDPGIRTVTPLIAPVRTFTTFALERDRFN